ncbi:mitotic apparatus protein p62-like protein [Tanacetum coccineum]
MCSPSATKTKHMQESTRWMWSVNKFPTVEGEDVQNLLGRIMRTDWRKRGYNYEGEAAAELRFVGSSTSSPKVYTFGRYYTSSSSRCQTEGCDVDLTHAKHYHRRHKSHRGRLEYHLYQFGGGDDDPEYYPSECVTTCLPCIPEFGFVVMGHEFDNYPKKMIHDIRSWDWFLEEHKEDSDEDEDEVSNKKAKKGIRRKRKKGAANDDKDDDVWTEKQKGSTSKSGKDTAKSYAMDVDVEDGNETDEMLDGFIVDDEDVGEEIDNDLDGVHASFGVFILQAGHMAYQVFGLQCSIYFSPHASLLSETRTSDAISSYIEDIDIVNDDIEMSGIQDDFLGHYERELCFVVMGHDFDSDVSGIWETKSEKMLHSIRTL